MEVVPESPYLIVPKCAPTLSLGIQVIDGSPVAVLQPLANRAPSQYWIAHTADADSGYAFTAGEFQLFMNIVGQSPALLLTWMQIVQMEEEYPNFGQASGSWNLIPNGDFFAVQNVAQTSQNLNVQGNGPYPAGTPVLVWSWGGGAPNELWQFVAW